MFVTGHEALKWLLTFTKSTSAWRRGIFAFSSATLISCIVKIIKHQSANVQSHLKTIGHDTAEIDDDLPGSLIIGGITDLNSTQDVSDTFKNRRSYIDNFGQADAFAYVMTGSRKA